MIEIIGIILLIFFLFICMKGILSDFKKDSSNKEVIEPRLFSWEHMQIADNYYMYSCWKFNNYGVYFKPFSDENNSRWIAVKFRVEDKQIRTDIYDVLGESKYLFESLKICNFDYIEKNEMGEGVNILNFLNFKDI